MSIIVAIANVLILPIVVTLVWEFWLRDSLLPHFRKLNYRLTKALRKEPPMGELLRRLTTLCQSDQNTLAITQREEHVGLALDGSFEIIHSHLYKGWREHEIEFLPLAKLAAPPGDLADLVANHRPDPPNNGKYRLYRYVPDSSERPTIQIQLAATDYFSTYPIQRRLFERILQDDRGVACSPFEKYGDRLLEFGDHPLPNIVCLHTVVALPGNKLLITQRIRSKDRIDWEQGKWSCSFEEQMTVKVGEPRNDKTFFDTVYAGCEEELGVLRDRILDVRILSVIVDSVGGGVDPVALVTVESTFEDVKGYWQLKARDGVSRELRNVAELDWSPAALRPILHKQPVRLGEMEIGADDWHATSRMRLLVSLFYRYGIDQTVQSLTA